MLLTCAPEPERVEKRGAAFAPPEGKLLYLSHQHVYRQEEQAVFVNQAAPYPAGVVFYTSLLLNLSTDLIDSRELSSLLPWLEQREHLMPVLLLSIDRTQFQPICEGRFDDNIAELAGILKKMQRPVYLSVGIEVNNPMYRNDPEEYKAAYRCFVDKLTAHAVDNVSFLWYVIGMKPGYLGLDPMAWYPGDEYVNWLATSIYKFEKEHFLEKALFTGSDHERLLEIAHKRDLPLMIVESSAVSVKKNFALSGTELWEFWYAPFFELLRNHPRIRAFSHLNHDWEDSELKNRWLDKMAGDRFLRMAENGYTIIEH